MVRKNSFDSIKIQAEILKFIPTIVESVHIISYLGLVHSRDPYPISFSSPISAFFSFSTSSMVSSLSFTAYCKKHLAVCTLHHCNKQYHSTIFELKACFLGQTQFLQNYVRRLYYNISNLYLGYACYCSGLSFWWYGCACSFAIIRSLRIALQINHKYHVTYAHSGHVNLATSIPDFVCKVSVGNMYILIIYAESFVKYNCIPQLLTNIIIA